jgi:hypothetical protein
MLSYGFVNLLQAQWAQPYEPRFYVLIGGLISGFSKKTYQG